MAWWLENNGARPGTGDAPLDYRLPFTFAPSATATSSRTPTAICLASFDESNFHTTGMTPPLQRAR